MCVSCYQRVHTSYPDLLVQGNKKPTDTKAALDSNSKVDKNLEKVSQTGAA